MAIVQPIDYTSGNGFAQGLQLKGLQDEVQQRALAVDQARLAAEQQAQFQKDWQSSFGDPQKMTALAAKYPGQMEAIKAGIGFQDEQHQMALGNAARDLRIAIATRNPQAVQGAAMKHAQTLGSINSSPDEILQLFQQDPQSLAQTVDAVGMNALGAKDYYGVENDRAQRQNDQAKLAEQMRANRASESLQGQQIAVSRANAQLAASTGMTGHNIAAARLQLDQNKFAFDIQQAQEKAQLLKDAAPKITDSTSKMIDSSINDATASRNSADSMSALAQQFRQEKPTTGLFGNANNMFSKLTGSETALRDLRIRQNAIINSQVLKYLPPGPATDRDVNIAREGAPSTWDDPEIVANWLDANARLERRASQFNEFKSEWLSANGNPGQSRNDGSILGMDVRKGESLGQAAKRYMAQNPIEQQAAAPNTQQVQPAQVPNYNSLWGG